MSKNLTRGVMSTEESTSLTLLSSLCASASLKGEIYCFNLTWSVPGLKSLKGEMNKDVCQISCLNLTWKVRGLQQEISSWNWNMQCEDMSRNHCKSNNWIFFKRSTTHLLYDVPLPTSKLSTETQLPAEMIVSVFLALTTSANSGTTQIPPILLCDPQTPSTLKSLMQSCFAESRKECHLFS